MKSTDTNTPEITSTFLNTQNDRTPSIWFSKRFLVAILLCLGFTLYSMECLMGTMAIVEMTTTKQIVHGNRTITQPAEFDWDSITIGIILNMFWYGFFFSPVGGTLTQKFGGSVTLGISMMFTGVITLLSPITLQWHFYLFLACRGLVGMFEGFSSASTAATFSRWVPKKERPVFISAIINGMYIGGAIIYPFCGFVAYYWGWRMIFYTTGFLCTMWSVIWLILVRNEPSNDKWISKKELIYILKETEDVQRKHINDYPYKDILTSAAFWALFIGKFSFGWGSTFIPGYLPFYISDKTQKSVKDIGFLSCVPQIFVIILIPIAGMLMGYWQNHTNLKATQIHKIVISVDLIVCAVLYTIIPFLNDFFVENICFIIITVLLSCNKVVLELITVNMAPNHSSLVSGLSLCGQTIGFIITQSFTGFIVKTHKMDEWNICFFTSTGVLMTSAAIFILYGSSEPQPWSFRDIPHMNKIMHNAVNKNPHE